MKGVYRMKKCRIQIIICLLFLFGQQVYGEYWVNKDSHILKWEKDSIEISYFNRDKCEIEIIEKFIIFEIFKREDFTYLKIKGNLEELLVLKSSECICLYKQGQKKAIFTGLNGNVGQMGMKRVSFEIDVSSTYSQNGQTFPKENLLNNDLDSPWVEGSDGNGENEFITTENQGTLKLILSSGFVSYDYPKLYKENNRPKIILITDLNNDEEFVFELKDSPDPQVFEFPGHEMRQLKLEIIEVYKGTKYNDLAINFIDILTF